MTGAITLAAAAVVSAGVGAYEAYSSSQTAGTELGMAETTQGEQMYYNSMLQQLIANPSSVTQLPGYQFQLDQGSKAVADAMGPGGFAGSGNEAAALTTFGQGVASSFYGQQTSLLASLSGVTNASSPSQSATAGNQATQTSLSTISSLLNSLGFYGKLAGTNTGAPSGTPGASTGGVTGGDPSYGQTGLQ